MKSEQLQDSQEPKEFDWNLEPPENAGGSGNGGAGGTSSSDGAGSSDGTGDRSRGCGSIIRTLLRLLLIVIILGLLTIIAVLIRDLLADSELMNRTRVIEGFSPVLLPELKSNYLFLMLGTDLEFHGAPRTDTMIAVFVNVPRREVFVLSIPRDNVWMYRGERQKINAAYAFGYARTRGSETEKEAAGIKLAKESVEKLLERPIDHILKIDLSGFVKLIDMMGGVSIYVEKDMKYDDFKQKLHIRLKKGQQVLDGEKTMHFVRFRHDRLGDLGRMRRQQAFIQALISRLSEPEVLVRLPKIIETGFDYLTTDLTLPLSFSFLKHFKDLRSLKLKTGTCPGSAERVDDLWYYFDHPRRLKALIESIEDGSIFASADPDVEPLKSSDLPVPDEYSNIDDTTEHQLQLETLTDSAGEI